MAFQSQLAPAFKFNPKSASRLRSNHNHHIHKAPHVSRLKTIYEKNHHQLQSFLAKSLELIHTHKDQDPTQVNKLVSENLCYIRPRIRLCKSDGSIPINSATNQSVGYKFNPYPVYPTTLVYNNPAYIGSTEGADNNYSKGALDTSAHSQYRPFLNITSNAGYNPTKTKYVNSSTTFSADSLPCTVTSVPASSQPIQSNGQYYCAYYYCFYYYNCFYYYYDSNYYYMIQGPNSRLSTPQSAYISPKVIA